MSEMARLNAKIAKLENLIWRMTELLELCDDAYLNDQLDAMVAEAKEMLMEQ